MVLAVHPPPSGEMKEIEVPFEPPMADFREFRSRLIGWRDEAFKRYNVVRLIAFICLVLAFWGGKAHRCPVKKGPQRLAQPR